jgi:hypothetical protein
VNPDAPAGPDPGIAAAVGITLLLLACAASVDLPRASQNLLTDPQSGA